MLSYCPPNVSLSDLWVQHGLSQCLVDTVAYSFMTAFVVVFGGIQLAVYRRYATDLSPRMLPRSWLFRAQVAVTCAMPLVALLRLVLLLFVAGQPFAGYMGLVVACNWLMWPASLWLTLLERRKALPSVPTWGHGLVVLFFWTMAFVNENLAFLNMRKRSWWFDDQDYSDRFEMAFFVVRYACTMFLFAVGIKAPGIPTARDYFVYTRQEAELMEPLLERPSAFSDFWTKCRRLLRFVWPRRNLRLQLQVLVCLCLLVAGRVVNLLLPITYKRVVDALSAAQGPSFPWRSVLAYACFYFLQGQGTNSLLTNLRSLLWIRIQQYTVRELQADFYAHLLNLSLRWHLGRKTGEVLRVLDRGTDSITNLLSYVLFNILPAVADIAVAVVYLSLSFGGYFGLIVFLTMLLYLAGTVAITEWRTKFRREMNDKDNAVRTQAVDALLNYETVKYFTAEQHELDAYRRCIQDYQKAEFKTSASLSLLNTAQSFTITAGILSGTLLCAHLIADERTLTVGDYVLFSTYLTQLYGPLGFFGTYYRMIQRSFIDMENMVQIFDEQPEVRDKPGARWLSTERACGADIEFRNVTFWYSTPEKQVLKDVSFRIAPGKTVALVGPSGSGKSTIVRLLFRFYDIPSGSILIDGIDVREYNQESVRQQIGVVPQDVVLFNRDVRHNIRYGRPSASDQEVEEAARIADIHERIVSCFPNGYDTLVGERGLKLSGGEKQRVAIARAVLKNPSVILLDEATSSLDSQTERNVQQALQEICARRTTVVVAHRLSTVVDAHQILVLKEGRIVERGTHEELLAIEDGTYRTMWEQQTRDAAKGDDADG